MNKWDYITKIKELSTIYNDRLLQLMDYYNKDNLQKITYAEAKEFWEKLNMEQ